MSNADSIERYGMKERQLLLLRESGVNVDDISVYRGEYVACRKCGYSINRGVRVHISARLGRNAGRNYHGPCVGRSPMVRAALKAAGHLKEFDELAIEVAEISAGRQTQ